MPFTVYCLSDPRTPHIMRYVGRTSAHHKKRLSDHIAAARFHPPEKHTPNMAWLASLDAEGLRAVVTPLAVYPTESQAQQAEELITETFKGLLLNSPTAGRGGRPVGSVDSPAAKRRKSEAWKRDKARERRIESRAAGYVRIREELGYPHPELHVSHPLNEAHNRALRGVPPRTRVWSATASASAKRHRLEKFHAWRVAIGCPHPEHSVFHHLNKEWKAKADAERTFVRYVDWEEGRRLQEGALTLVPKGKELN